MLEFRVVGNEEAIEKRTSIELDRVPQVARAQGGLELADVTRDALIVQSDFGPDLEQVVNAERSSRGVQGLSQRVSGC